MSIDIQNLRTEIRTEAAALALPGMPAPDHPTPANTALSLEHPQRNDYCLADFVHVHQEAFVELAYRCLLKRAPDGPGMLDLLHRLAEGDSKIAILGDLRWSVEGRGHAVRVRGLALRYRYWRVTRWPVIGGVIERCALILALPEIAREQRRLGQSIAQADRVADTADLAVQLRAMRDELDALRRSREHDPAPPA
ncbi:MAG: hypothetical protein ABI411_02995 [Tahibacter sp.]